MLFVALTNEQPDDGLTDELVVWHLLLNHSKVWVWLNTTRRRAARRHVIPMCNMVLVILFWYMKKVLISCTKNVSFKTARKLFNEKVAKYTETFKVSLLIC